MDEAGVLFGSCFPGSISFLVIFFLFLKVCGKRQFQLVECIVYFKALGGWGGTLGSLSKSKFLFVLSSHYFLMSVDRGLLFQRSLCLRSHTLIDGENVTHGKADETCLAAVVT